MGLNVLRGLGIALAVLAVLYGAMQVGARLERAEIDARSAEVIASLQGKLDAVSKDVIEAEAALDAALLARTKLEGDLTNEAFQDPGAGRVALGADSVRRLNRAR